MATHVWLHHPKLDAYWQSPVEYAPIAKVDGWADSDGPADLYADAVAAAPTPTAAPVEAEQTGFDPAEHSAQEVQDYLDGVSENSPGERERVLELERDGKNRKSITGD